ncbi:MAG TPA: ABC transporter ATP-binding protein [Rhizomicrobium sp.]|jgi:ABC-type bacteriocin/lantibiotic exporter with double-glycine peptidase domain|nr:ABC transporter ATP-binding protein [Rhizomicrobium sp.]
MFDVVKKLNSLLDRRWKLRLAAMLGLLSITALFEMVGTVAIFGFARLAMSPEEIQSHEPLKMLYAYSGASSTADFLIMVGISVVVIYILKNGLGLLSLWAEDHAAFAIVNRLATRLMRTYLMRPYEWIVGTNTAILNRNILAETQQMGVFLILPLFSTIADGLVVLALIGLLLWYNPIVTTLLFGSIAAVYIVFNIPIRRVNLRRGRIRMQSNEKRFRVTQDAFSGFKEIRLSGTEGFFTKRFARASKDFTIQLARTRFLAQVPRSTVETLGVLSIFGLILYALIEHQSMQEIIPTIMLYAAASFRMLPSFTRISRSIADIQFNKSVLDTLYPDMLEGVKNSRLQKPLPPLIMNRAIEACGLQFRYAAGEADCIRGVSLRIPKNTSAAFVGRTGAGKSTLIELICGLLAPGAGKIQIDDATLTAANSRQWQQTIGYVPQHIYLIDDTIARNIAFGMSEDKVDMASVAEAARLAHLAEFIEKELPLGYDTVIGERGVRLSGGQRQRLGIARALYARPQLLILDEATSALDVATEQIISEMIAELVGDLTVIIIAHRLSTIRHCDRIYLLEGGEIVQSGTYDELLSRSAEFRAIAGTLQDPIADRAQNTISSAASS